MTVSDILSLTNAGFTKDEIFKLASLDAPAPAGGNDTPAPAPASVPAPGAASIEAPAAPAPAPSDNPAPAPDTYTSNYVTTEELAELIRTIRADNINTLGGNNAPAPTVDDMIATIINPYENKGG